MKSEEVKIDTDVSEAIWSRGITKPPRKIRVRMTKDEDGLVKISLPKTKVSSEEESDQTALEEGTEDKDEEPKKGKKASKDSAD
jgi:Ribosomal protein L31e